MGAGASIATESRLTKKTKPTQRHQVEDKVTTRLSNDGRNDSTKVPTSIDARIVATLRLLNLTRRADPKRNQNTHFERIVLQFALVREAFSALRSIYQQLASTDKDGLDFEGLKMALIALGIHINEYDLTEIFYESDMEC
ncbi:conserved hypothetical protein [Plasmopara halstedii]|uniref:EF-hand domain pair n=1 Tax=Plasmopara halstedii TaxID=4781 RepID=A0A0P1A525_PLAHL|nr:conserved hypothetical protein [Plasmopara halstedii]CEG35216.1 conserved hypothetical protein [Plasmopara halstedii]|eukprot:XP_024571585.1 conserved hypothetical protein [Plasmopara halstedii]